jgi:hypothetical protein
VEAVHVLPVRRIQVEVPEVVVHVVQAEAAEIEDNLPFLNFLIP